MDAIKKLTNEVKETLRQHSEPPPSGRGRLLPSPNYVYFDAVARHGSIRKAAESLHIASSALNRRMLDLEAEIGSALFERLPRGVRLTAAGELFLNHVRAATREFRALEAQLEQLRGQTRGAVRVAVAESVTPSLLPKAISSYRQEHPGVGFHVVVGGPHNLAQALLDDEVDLILTHEAPEKPGISVLAEAVHPLCALVVPGHPLASLSGVQLSECVPYPWALPDHSLAARALLDLAIEQASLPVVPTLESNSIETLKSFARHGGAICFSFHLGSEAEAQGLVAVPLRDRICQTARLYLAARRGRVLPVAAASFAEQLRDALAHRICARPMSVV